MKTATPCCNRQVPAGDTGPIFWNPYNEIVQCHACGQSFEPIKTAPSSQGEEHKG